MLDVNLTAVIIQAIAFILLAVLLGKFALRPVASMIETRQAEIQGTLDKVAADRLAMEQSRAEYERRLAEIEAEAREHVVVAMRQAQEEAAALLAKAREDASEQRGRALADIDQERKKAVAQIRGEMADLAVLAAGKILEREINPAVHRDLISDFIGRQ